MSFFRKLLSGSGKRESHEYRKARRIVEKVGRECEPIGKLQSNLIHAFCQCAEEVKCYFTSQKLKEPACWFLLRQEFLHYFIHITQRNAFSQGYTEQERDALGDILLVVLDISLEEAPEAKRSEARELVIDQANAAEMDYSTAKGIYPTDDGMTLGDSVYAKLARRIEARLGREHDSSIAFQIISATSKQFVATRIPDLLKQIRPFVCRYKLTD